MCDCNYTLFDILCITNQIRQKKNLCPLPYSYVLKGWHTLLKDYQGKRNPYVHDRKIGRNYTFSKFKSRKIAKKLSDVNYNGNSSSFGYQYWWWKAA